MMIVVNFVTPSAEAKLKLQLNSYYFILRTGSCLGLGKGGSDALPYKSAFKMPL
jgi:hypothetical protein